MYDIFVDEQNGFRKNRACIDHVYTLTSIIRINKKKVSNMNNTRNIQSLKITVRLNGHPLKLSQNNGCKYSVFQS